MEACLAGAIRLGSAEGFSGGKQGYCRIAAPLPRLRFPHRSQARSATLPACDASALQDDVRGPAPRFRGVHHNGRRNQSILHPKTLGFYRPYTTA